MLSLCARVFLGTSPFSSPYNFSSCFHFDIVTKTCKLNHCSCTHLVAPVYCDESQGCWRSTKISYSTYYLLSSGEVFNFVTSASFRLCEKDWDFPAAAFENLPIYTSWEKERMSFWFYTTSCFFGTLSQEKSSCKQGICMMLLHVYDLFLEPNPDITLTIPLKLLIPHDIANTAHFVYNNEI